MKAIRYAPRLPRLAVFLVAAALALLVPQAVSQAHAQAEDGATAQLVEVPGSDSGITGSATVAPRGEDATLVTVRLEGGEPGITYPGHLHEGTYENGEFDFDPEPSYDLEDAVGGVSRSTLDVPFDELMSTDYLIAMHLPTGSGQGSGTDVAGNPYGPAVAAGPIEPSTLPDTGGPDLPANLAVGLLAAAGLVLATRLLLTVRARSAR